MERNDEVLGPIRYCEGCDEWWPVGDEFWGARRVCLACLDERRERRRAQVRNAVRRFKQRQLAEAS